MSFIKKYRIFEIIGLIAIALLVWFVGPLLGFGEHTPLDSVMSRAVTIAVIVLLWVAYRLLRWHLAKRKEKQLMQELAQAQDETGQATNAEQLNLQRGFDEALGLLRTARGKKQQGQQFLYELPWYVIIGSPGAGKTTALINSGLNFPLADKLGKRAVKGSSGTRDCDWWFTDEAVLLDTAGRYTTQDSHQEVDAAAWQNFLQLLSKYRPRRPLNGVLVAVSVTDLLSQTEAELKQQAAQIRQRIQELNTQLGVNLPVYTLFTKTDLVAGFTDFFVNLSEEERNQVWGETFPLPAEGQAVNGFELFGKGYDELLERLLQRRLKRLQEERDAQRRTLIFDFPEQMRLLKPTMIAFLTAVFAANRYEAPLLFRGAYFTSGTQEGTPIDRIMGALASVFQLNRQSQPLFSGRGKSYFLTRLLKQVVFPEAELVGVNEAAERRFRMLKLGSYIATGLLVVLVMVLWGISFATNKAAMVDIEQQLAGYQTQKLTPDGDWQSNLQALLVRMDALQAAKTVYDQAGWQAGFGLSQADKVQSGIDAAYQYVLRNGFAKLISQRLKARMQGAEGNNLDVLYQLLRVYLMFNQPERMDGSIAQPWIKLDWQNNFATQPEVQARLQTHLDNLLALKLDPIVVDDAFVDAVRQKLKQVPLAMQVYNRFKTENLLDHAQDIRVLSALAPNGSLVFMKAGGQAIDDLVIPGLFTSQGYADIFLKTAQDYVKAASEQNWVLNRSSGDDDYENQRLFGDFKKLYLADYQRVWANLLNSLKFRPQQTNNQLIDILDVLSRPDSPLRLLLGLVDKHSSLSKITADLTDALTKAPASAVKAPVVPGVDTKKLLATAKQADGGDQDLKALEAYFEPYAQQVRSAEGRPAPLDSSLTSLKNLHDYLLQIGSAPNSGGQALSTEMAKFAGGGIDPMQSTKTEIARLPEPIASSLTAMTSLGGKQLRDDAKTQLNEVLKTAVTLPCNAALSGRYPFIGSSNQEVLLADFTKLFAVGGVLDQFFSTNLKAFVDTTSLQWQELKSEKALGLSPTTIRQFQIAAKIRDAFFATAGNLPQVQFELKPQALDDRVGTFRLNIEGQELVYRHGPEQINKFQWPGIQSSNGVRLVIELLDGRQLSRVKEGNWALFRMLEAFNLQPTATPERFVLNINIEGYTASFELRAASVNNPFGMAELRGFRCPEVL